MKNQNGKILYVGKAKNLRQRIKQYFVPGRDGRMMVPYLTTQIEVIDTIIVDSEKEALLLENTLIKKHKPKYNALLKDDKTFFSLQVNHQHKWPMIRVARFKGIPPKGVLTFGPYVHGTAARQTLELLRHLFPLRQCSDHELASRTRPCILYDLKRCIAPCVEKCTEEDYDTLVKQVIAFLRGHDSQILKTLQKELNQAIEMLAFEKAQRIHETMRSIEKTIEKQKVDHAGQGDKDVLALYREADSVVLAQMLYREGKLIASYTHRFENNAQEDAELLSSFIVQHYPKAQFLPQEIILPTPLFDQTALKEMIKCQLTVPRKGNKNSLIKMAQMNAKAKFVQEGEKKNKFEQILIGLEEKLHLTNYPERIECFDQSNTFGTEPVSGMVVYINGMKDKKKYRIYAIKTAAPKDDYGALEEVLQRRCRRAKEEDNLPDLIIIDGGKGHLNVALRVLQELNISTCDLISVAKEEGLHTKGMTQEKIFLPERSDPIILPTHSPLLFFLQQVRDEAHRLAISFHRKKRSKKMFTSTLDTISGIGPIKKKRLLSHFGSVKRIYKATEKELLEVKGMTKKDVKAILCSKNKDKCIPIPLQELGFWQCESSRD